MDNKSYNLIKIALCILIAVSQAACTNGQIDPSKALTQMHVLKNEDYKKRPGWDAAVRLGNDDCLTYKNGGDSLFKWNGIKCDDANFDNNIIKAVNEKPKSIPIFYAAYHEYGNDKVGGISAFDKSPRTTEEIIKILANLSSVLSSSKQVDQIYADFENDRWSMGLAKVSRYDFNNGIAQFVGIKDELIAHYQKIQSENQRKTEEERAKNAKREQQELTASDRPIELVLWSNPTPEQQLIINALNTIKFSVRSDMVAYANGRWFMGVDGLEYLRNSLDMSMSSCSDVGAYVGEKVFSRACIQGLAQSIVEWGRTANDRSISDQAWRYAAFDGSITYNPIKYEILFSHWAGMAHVYASRGY